MPRVLGGRAVRTLEKPGAALLRALALPSRHLSLDVLEFSGHGLWWQIVRGSACGKAVEGRLSPLRCGHCARSQQGRADLCYLEAASWGLWRPGARELRPLGRC